MPKTSHKILLSGIWPVLAALLPSCVLPSVTPLGRRATVQRDVIYTPSSWPSPQRADVFRPVGRSACPAVLLIHGGNWSSEEGRWQMEDIAKRLARRGYVVVNADYRGLPEDPYPAPVEDMHEALRWMRQNAPQQGIDPNRIATFGYSAGGHLAALVALDRKVKSPPVQAIVAGGGPFDLTLYPGGDIVPKFLETSLQKDPAKFREASPAFQVTKHSPPLFLYHASGDTLVPPEHALKMQAAYRAQGLEAPIRWMPGSHIRGFLTSGPAVEDAIDFLDKTFAK